MAGKQWSPRRPRVTTEELIAWVSQYYPEDAVARSYNPKTGKAIGPPHIYDGLAKFIVNEILDLYTWEGDDTDDEALLDIIARAFETASKELAKVSDGVTVLLHEVMDARSRKG